MKNDHVIEKIHMKLPTTHEDKIIDELVKKVTILFKTHDKSVSYLEVMVTAASFLYATSMEYFDGNSEAKIEQPQHAFLYFLKHFAQQMHEAVLLDRELEKKEASEKKLDS